MKNLSIGPSVWILRRSSNKIIGTFAMFIIAAHAFLAWKRTVYMEVTHVLQIKQLPTRVSFHSNGQLIGVLIQSHVHIMYH